jgi:hypothetical protein
MLMAVVRCVPDVEIRLRHWRKRLAAAAAIMLQCESDKRCDLTTAGFSQTPPEPPCPIPS